MEKPLKQIVLRRIILAMLGGLLCNAYVFAQEDEFLQGGPVTHDMTTEGFVALHSSFTPGRRIKIVNEKNGTDAVITILPGRIRSTPDRMMDISNTVWEALGLTDDNNQVKLYSAPADSSSTVASAPPPPPPPPEPAYTPPPPPDPEPPPPPPAPAAQPAPAPAAQPTPAAQPAPAPAAQTVPAPSPAPVLQPAPAARPAPRPAATPIPGTLFMLVPWSPSASVPSVTAAGRVEIVPGLPDPNSRKTYRLQVGAFSIPGNADRIERSLRAAGFVVVQEPHTDQRYGHMQRVMVIGVPAADVFATAQRLGALDLGIKQVLVRE